MQFNYHFFVFYNAALVESLELNKVKYKFVSEIETPDGKILPKFVCFDIKGNSELVNSLAVSFRATPIYTHIIYSESERKNAKLLWITPKKQIVDILNSDDAFLYTCCWVDSRGEDRAHHQKQIKPFVIRREATSNTGTAFWTIDTGFSFIFTDLRVRKLVDEHKLQGIRFLNAYRRNGTTCMNTFQMLSDNKINSNCIEIGKGEKIISCPMCGKQQYVIDGTYQLHLLAEGLNLNSDFYQTDDLFGEGYARPAYLISQRFYQILKEHKLTSGLHIEPVVLQE